MRRILQQVREMSDERKGVFATTVAAACTAVVIGIWSVSFMEFVAETEPATAVDSKTGPVESFIDQLGALFSEMEMGSIVSTSTNSMADFVEAVDTFVEVGTSTSEVPVVLVAATSTTGFVATTTSSSTAISASTTQNYFYQGQ